MTVGAFHTPVLAGAVAGLAAGARRAVDGTAGGGGHTALLRAAGASVLAIDRDPEAVAAARARLGTEGITWRTGRFAADEILAEVATFAPDFVLLDLGVSSHQLDRDARGFSFRPGLPLDMRMSGSDGLSAADLLNALPVDDLARLFREHGDERRAGALARSIIERRADRSFATSDDLVNAIRRTLGPRAGPPEFARLFQALRIAVNGEAEELERALPTMRDALVPGGILAVIAYHSGEDRRVKHAFRAWCRSCVCPPELPVCRCRGRALGRLLTRKPVTADAVEVAANPRARSARLRAFARADGA